LCFIECDYESFSFPFYFKDLARGKYQTEIGVNYNAEAPTDLLQAKKNAPQRVFLSVAITYEQALPCIGWAPAALA
jgi:hypothetical protein